MSATALEAVLPEINQRFSQPDDQYSYSFRLQPLTEIALGPELVNKIGKVMEDMSLYIFLIIAVLIMLPAIFNYVSLTVARSLKRAKEIGVRKVSGANRPQIIRQFLAESVIVALLSLIPASLLLHWLLPAFGEYDFVKYIVLDWRTDISVYVFFILFGCFCRTFGWPLPGNLSFIYVTGTGY